MTQESALKPLFDKHTPGNWGYATPIGEKAAKDGYAIYAITDDLKRYHIGFVSNIVDANLIAAAPDMLEALEKMLCAFPYQESENRREQYNQQKANEAARAAIKKARGI